jgi:predicted nucleotide-binding protein
MEQSALEKLDYFVNLGENASEEYLYDRWDSRVASFLRTSLGPDKAQEFIGLEANNWFEMLPMKIGYLEGLQAKMTAAQSPVGVETKGGAEHIEIQMDSRKVFVVHGHDNEAKETLARFLVKLDLQPIILHEQPSEGRTIIEKFENYSQDVAFAIVLLTPDDLGSAASDATIPMRRARQNVIMELGYFIGKLGRSRVCAMHKGGVELPSDYQGVLYIEMDEAGAWKAKIAQELVQSKVRIELKGLLGV